MTTLTDIAETLRAHQNVVDLTIHDTSAPHLIATIREFSDFTVTVAVDDDGMIHDSVDDGSGPINTTHDDLAAYIEFLKGGEA